MTAKYLVVNGLEFNNGVVHNGTAYNILPSQIVPKSEIIKTTERSLNGTMCVDITGVKKKLSITFDYLADKDFRFIRDFLSLDKPEEMDADGLQVEYFDFIKSKEKSIICFTDGFNYTPYIEEDEISWRNVSLELVEI